MVAELIRFDESENGERRLRAPLIEFLTRRRWIRPDTIIVDELPWHGRRVDMVTRTRGGILTSYEFKLGSFGRVLEQALYNRLSFDRSYVVVTGIPRAENLNEAARHQIGIVVVDDNTARCLLLSPLSHADPVLRQRLSHKVISAGARSV